MSHPPVGTFAELWRTAVDRSPDATFLLFHDDTGTCAWTYAEFGAVVDAVARTLASRGVGPGDAVHLVLRSCPAFVALWLAAAWLGAWIVPADPAASARDLEQQLRWVRPRIGFHGRERAQTYRDAAGEDGPVHVALAESAADLLAGAPLVSAPPPSDRGARSPAPADRLAVMFTSGTTAQPKGVVLTQASYRHVAEVMAEAAALEARHRWFVTLPLFHANAQYYCFAPAIAAGASVALTSRFSASAWVRTAHELAVTHASLFAAPIRMILARTAGETPPLALEHVWFAQSLGRQHHQEFAALVGTAPRQLYGMTETVAIVTADVHRPPRHDVIGRPVAGRPVALRDPTTGEDVRTGDPGIITVRGERGVDLFAGYLDDPVTTAAAFEERDDGTWFSTGDLARVDDEGDLRFVGRVDDVIKVAGENVSLTEVEAALGQAPGVLEVAVVSRRDPVRDQVPIAFVVPRDPERPPDLGELAAWAEHNLSPAARPREWHVIAELPRTSVGKIRRFAITQPDLAPSGD